MPARSGIGCGDRADVLIESERPRLLKPAGFFDRNPTLDVPALGGHCHAKVP
jgi:hypothetical protein